MIELLLAQAGVSIINLVILVIVVAGIIGVAFVVIRAAGVNVPPWIVTIGWIVLAVVVGVVAIKFLASLL